MYVKLCSVNEISPGEMKQFNLKDMEILVANLDGKLYCLEGRCSHAGAPLAEGYLQSETITCPWHYSKFKIKDGEVLKGPANKALRVYETKINDGRLLVELRDKES